MSVTVRVRLWAENDAQGGGGIGPLQEIPAGDEEEEEKTEAMQQIL